MPRTQCKLPVEVCHLLSPIGHINLSSCCNGLHTVSLDSSLSDENFAPDESTDVKIMGKAEEDLSPVMKTCYIWFQQYFTHVKQVASVKRPDICILKQEKPGFQTQVLQKLADTVGPGEVITYGALASRLNNPGAVRAVGSAMRNNPIGLIVPCHRVVRSNDMGLYHGGTRQSVKLWLLRHEGVEKY